MERFRSSYLLLGAAAAAIILSFAWRVIIRCWVTPRRDCRKLRENGLEGPPPVFPIGNINEMKKAVMSCRSIRKITDRGVISHDIHASVFPYFACWQKLHGKVFVYWLGTEPFLYVADPEFLKQLSSGVMGKTWGKPTVFKRDREPMFGKGLVMTEGDEWVRRRHAISPAFSPANLKRMVGLMVESTDHMLDKWTAKINSGDPELDIEREIILTAGEIIAKTSFGISHEDGKKVFDKLRAMQVALFKTNRYVGVPFSKILCPASTLEADKLGREIDGLLMSIINDRKNDTSGIKQHDLLGIMLENSRQDGRSGENLSTRDLADDCKTFFFGGHETTALALTWTLLLLAMHPEWQDQLREEMRDVIGDQELDATSLAGLKKMNWVWNEVLRLYSPAPNVQRQIREDMRVNEETVVPAGTNMWIDVVAMNHDPELWGEDVNEFKPERFRDDPLYGGCNHKMGFLPFGFGGRMCIGKNMSAMEYKVVLALVLSRFSLSVSPNYRHSPSILLSLRPSQGLPLIVKPLPPLRLLPNTQYK